MPLKNSAQQQAPTPKPNGFNAVVATSRRQPPSFGRVKKVNESIDDLENDEALMERARRFTEYLGTRDDIWETLRDSDYNIYQGIKRASEAGDWPDEIKADYAELRTRFDNADTGSFNQYLEAAKDIGVDILTDPVTIATLLAAPFTGGASVGARQAASVAAKQTAKRFTAAQLGMVDGFVWTGVDAYTREKTAEAVGLTDGVNGVKVAATAAIGGIAGGLLGRFIDGNTLDKAERAFSPSRVQAKVAMITGDDGVVREVLQSVPSPATQTTRQWYASTVAKTVGKPAGVLDPAAKVSPTAERLQKLFRYDLGKQLNAFTVNRKARAVSPSDFNEVVNVTLGDFYGKYKEAIAPIAFNGRKIDKKSQAELARVLRIGIDKASGEGVNETMLQAARQVRGLLDDIGKELGEAGLIKTSKNEAGEEVAELVTNYVPRRWKRAVIQKNQEELAELFLREGQVADLATGRELVRNMLDIKNQLHTPSGGVFNAPRTLLDIKDDSTFAKFLDNDFNEIMHEYLHGTSVKLGAMKTFGTRNEKEFIQRWLNPIIDDYKAAGLEMPAALRNDVVNLYKYATGEGLEYWGAKGTAMKDWSALLYQVSLLPLATVSSITEVMLPLFRVRAPTYVKGLSQGLADGFKLLTVDMLDMLRVNHKLSIPQSFLELNKVGVALEEAMGDSFERLAGEGLSTKYLQGAQRGFFKANLLTPWTKFVQGAAFTMGKLHIKENLEYLARTSDTTSNTAIRILNELSDLGIDHTKGIAWLNKGALEEAGTFYDDIVRAGSRFTNEIVLSTAKRAGSKPLYMSHPKFDILWQLLGYPAAFTNTILKRMTEDFAESPIRTGAKTIVAGALITETARWLNYIRSDGKSEEGISPGEARLNAVARWGGNGLILDMAMRARDSARATGTPLAGVAGVFGPIVGDLMSIPAYRKGPAQFLGTKVPGYAAGNLILGKESMDDYTTWLREQDRKIASAMGLSRSKSSGPKPRGR